MRRYFWIFVAIVLGALGFIFSWRAGVVWALVVAVAMTLISTYYWVKPGEQVLEKISWANLAVILSGGLILGVIIRALFIAPPA